MERYRIIDAMIQEGYALILENNCTGGCDKWLEAWEAIKGLFTEGAAKDVFDLNSKYSWQEFPSNYVQDAEMELHNAGLEDSAYHKKRITFCEELCQWCGTDELMASNTRRAIADAHYELGDTEFAEQLYKGWLQGDPEWGWGYIGWSEHYHYKQQYEQAEEILLRGYMREGLRDKIDVIDRLIELYGDMGKPGKVNELKKALSELRPAKHKLSNTLKPSPVQVEKTGRNDPCPCGSGKKYKKCCGA